MNRPTPPAGPLGRLTNGFRHFVGFPASAYRGNEQLVAAVGGIVSIFFVLVISRAILGPQAAVLVVPSLGASAVLIFAVPHSPLTQPWAVLGGHVISALVGVACARLIPAPILAAGLAVGLAIGAMHAARCIHPPGGATALTAVIGGDAIHALGYGYAATPVLVNCLVMLTLGLAFNYAFPWRRYPASLMRYAASPKKVHAWPSIDEEHIQAAMDRLNVVIDISPEELGELIEQTLQIAEGPPGLAHPVRLDGIYCNDRPGPRWSVRQVIDERPSAQPELDLVIYKIVDGAGRGRTGSCTRQEFAAWIGSELNVRRVG